MPRVQFSFATSVVCVLLRPCLLHHGGGSGPSACHYVCIWPTSQLPHPDVFKKHILTYQQ